MTAERLKELRAACNANFAACNCDIKHRFGQPAYIWFGDCPIHKSETIEELLTAAEEAGRLREALRKIVRGDYDYGGCEKIARAALEGKA